MVDRGLPYEPEEAGRPGDCWSVAAKALAAIVLLSLAAAVLNEPKVRRGGGKASAPHGEAVGELAAVPAPAGAEEAVLP